MTKNLPLVVYIEAIELVSKATKGFINSNVWRVAMRPHGRPAKLGVWAAGFVFAMLGLVRRWRQRSRNLAELRGLDADRLEDIGLSEHARERITCTV